MAICNHRAIILKLPFVGWILFLVNEPIHRVHSSDIITSFCSITTILSSSTIKSVSTWIQTGQWTTQVDQEWPLVCHLLALVSHFRIQKCWRVWHFFYTFFRLIHTSCGISALFYTSLHGSVMKCFHPLYTYYTVSTLPVRRSGDLSTFWHFPTWNCHEVQSKEVPYIKIINTEVQIIS